MLIFITKLFKVKCLEQEEHDKHLEHGLEKMESFERIHGAVHDLQGFNMLRFCLDCFKELFFVLQERIFRKGDMYLIVLQTIERKSSK